MSTIDSTQRVVRRIACRALTAVAVLVLCATPARPQAANEQIIPVALTVGRSYPITTEEAITRVAVASPEVADAIVVSERELVISGKTNGETDVVLWIGAAARRHYRVQVRSAPERKMVLLAVRMAEVRKDLIHEFGTSTRYLDKDGKTRIGTGIFRSDAPFKPDGSVSLPVDTRFLTLLSNFGTKEFLGFLDTQEQLGRARLLAEPNILTADRDSATFLAGGELPIPVVQPGNGNQLAITIQYREFGVRLHFVPEIIGDSLVKLKVRPEVSSLDYTNAVVLQGFRIPAFRTRRVESTVDIRRDQSVVLSGMFNDEREQVRTGVPFLMDIPVLGALFSSSRWQSNQSELLIVVTPTLVDPAAIDDKLLLPLRPETRLPARDAIEKRLPPPRKP